MLHPKLIYRNYSLTEFNMVACRITDARNIAANNHPPTEQRHHLYQQHPPSSLHPKSQIHNQQQPQYQPQHPNQPQSQHHLHQQPLLLRNQENVDEKNTLDREILQQPGPQLEQQPIYIRNAGSNSTSQVPLTK